MIPNDPVMLLSYVNTQLRDYYSSLDALCDKGSIPAKKVGVLLFLISHLNKVLTES